MEGGPPSTLATHGAMGGLQTVPDAFPEDYCPYPPAPDRFWWLTAVLLIVLPAVLLARAFKWFVKLRKTFWHILYGLLEDSMLTSAPWFLDSQQIRKIPILGDYTIRLFFWWIQRSVPYPPRHLMSSAPSNSPGILTVLKTKSKLAGQCKYKDILTSDDFPVLPAQPRIFRTVDGFGNCPYSPHIGQAAQPYSFVAISKKKPVLDDEGRVIKKELPPTKDVFEKLLKRKEKGFEANEAGLNCLILDFATLLTHDLFNSHNGYNENSSYADLSPLYGQDADAARRVRVFKRGLLDVKKVPYSRATPVDKKSLEELKKIKAKAIETKTKLLKARYVKPEQASDDDSAGNAGVQALDAEDKKERVEHAEEWNWDWAFVGWRALVEVFGKEHNYVAGKLLEWYPDQFSHKFEGNTKQEELGARYDTDGLSRDNSDLEGYWINDEALYQTARYITTRIYGNIVVTDYASNFLGLKELNDFFVGRPNKLGNCCSYEFGLMYHWHCLLPDDSSTATQKKGVPWPSNETHSVLSERGPLPGDYYDQLSESDTHKNRFGDMLKAQEAKIWKQVDDASIRLEADDDVQTKLEQEVDHLPETELKLDELILARYNTPIGRFGPFHTPEYLRKAEERTMEKARLLGVCSYNDFRAHLNLMACTTYEEINPDPKVAKALRQLYETNDKVNGNENVDDVELYPGVFAERPGRKGIKFGNILSIGLLEDALNLIRNDRLLVDFNAASATPWGYQHAKSSHFADVIERHTGLKLVKEVDGNPTNDRVDYKTKYAPRTGQPDDWRQWRLASAALLTVPDKNVQKPGFQGTVRKEIFEGTKSTPGMLVKYTEPPPKPTVVIPPGSTSKTPAGFPTSHLDAALAETPGAED